MAESAEPKPQLSASLVIVDLGFSGEGPEVLPIKPDGTVDVDFLKCEVAFRSFDELLNIQFESVYRGGKEPNVHFELTTQEDGTHCMSYRGPSCGVKAVVNGVCYHDHVDELPLEHGDHVLLYSEVDCAHGTYWAGPLAFLYHVETVDEPAAATDDVERTASPKGDEPSAEPQTALVKPIESLQDLPPEVLTMIISKLPVDFCAYNVAAVSRKFFDLVSEGYKADPVEFDFEELSSSAACRALDIEGEPTTLVMRNAVFCEEGTVSPLFVEWLFSDFTRKVHTIELHAHPEFCNPDTIELFLGRVKEHYEDLTSLKVFSAGKYFVLGGQLSPDRFEALQTLLMESDEMIYDETYLQVTPRLKNLIVRCELSSDFWVVANEAQLLQLRLLEAPFLRNMAFDKLQNLTTLTLHVRAADADLCVTGIGTLKNLTALSLDVESGVPNLPIHDDNPFGKLPKGLITLELTGFGVDAATCKMIAKQCRKLQHVVLYSECYIGKQGIRHFLAFCRELVWLEVAETIGGKYVACEGVPNRLDKNCMWNEMLRKIFEGI